MAAAQKQQSPGRCAPLSRTTPSTSRTGSAPRSGIEGFIEPRTAVTDTTMLLVAIDGEWTRRRVPSVQWAHNFANKNGIPSYDAAVVGYPDRMRAYNKRQKGEKPDQADPGA